MHQQFFKGERERKIILILRVRRALGKQNN